MVESNRVTRGGVVSLVLQLLLSVHGHAQAPGPLWSQEPPIGGFHTEFLYVDAAGDLVVLGGRGPGVRTWRLASAWQEIVTASAPVTANDAAFAHDTSTDTVVRFGGSGAWSPIDETWSFDGATWTQLATSTAPPARTLAAFGYDPLRQRCVLYGGRAYSAGLRDTWEFDGSTWTQKFPATTPDVFFGGAMAFDENLGEMLLVGPGANVGDPMTTWRFDGVDWRRIVTANAPSTRRILRLAFNPARNSMLLFGGAPHFTGAANEDTWEFTNGDWVRRSTSGPPGIHGRGLVHWPRLGVAVQFGGSSHLRGPSGALYSWTGSGWFAVTAETAFDRSGPLLAYDSARGCIVLHGGTVPDGQWLDTTWEWRAATGWQQTSFGVGPSDAMVYDPDRQRIVAIDGADTLEYTNGVWSARRLPSTPPSGPLYFDRHRRQVCRITGAELWTYDGQSWSVAPIAGSASVPLSALAVHWSGGQGVAGITNDQRTLMRYDGATWTTIGTPSSNAVSFTESPRRGVVVAAGFDGTTWFGADGLLHTHANAHEELGGVRLVTDTVRGDVYAVGMQGQVWRLRWRDAPVIARYGAGCAGSTGVPDLRTIGPTTPALGQSVPLQLTSLPAHPGVAVTAFGDSIASWDGAVLPVSLASVGLPGCRAWIPLRTWQARSHAGGAHTFVLQLPASPLLRGAPFGVQAIVLDPAANGAWGSVSNALMITAW